MVVVDALFVREEDEEKHEARDQKGGVANAGKRPEKLGCEDVSQDRELSGKDRDEDQDNTQDEKVVSQ